MTGTGRQCRTCGEIKPLECFRMRQWGPLLDCRPCELASNREAGRKWRLANPGKVAAASARWRRASPDNTEKAKATIARWRAAHPDKVAASARRWRERHAERVRVTRRAATAVCRAILRGKLIRPEMCENCRVTGMRITAAHHDYTRPLDVRWLCWPCHCAWDKADPKTLRAVATRGAEPSLPTPRPSEGESHGTTRRG